MPDRPLTSPARRTRARSTARRRAAALVVAGLALAPVVACAADDADDVVSAGPSTTDTPSTPPVDNPTTTTTAAPTVTTPTSSTTTTDPDPAATTATSTVTTATSVPPASSVPESPVASPNLTMAVFWVRRPDDPRPLDLPGYRDPESGPKPLVVYGSATNDGTAAVASPVAVVRFVDGAGQTVAVYTTPILRPGSTTPAASLAPGETGDVIVVVPAPQGSALADLTPQLEGGAAG